jgi:hypothetical protein
MQRSTAIRGGERHPAKTVVARDIAVKPERNPPLAKTESAYHLRRFTRSVGSGTFDHLTRGTSQVRRR